MTRGDRVGTLITRLAVPHSDWSSGSRDSSVALHWSFLHSLSRRVTDLCRRLPSALKVGSLVTCHCIRSRFFRGISSLLPVGIGGRGSASGRRLGVLLQDGTGEVLNARVNCHPVVQFRIERKLIFQVSLEVGPVSAPEIRAIR